MSEHLKIQFQYLLPKMGLTRFAGFMANPQRGRVSTGLIRWFVGKYNVNMDEAANADIHSYTSFNDFFTRALKAGARPLAQADLVCPVDGAISQFGSIAGDQIFQAKGHQYSTQALLAGDAAMAAQFQNGSFATLYLSPKDYHRVHMPCAGVLQSMVYVPGDLFSVNPATARGIPGLFARNERLVCHFHGQHGPFVMVLVGATVVGSMATVWHGVVNPPRLPDVHRWDYPGGKIQLNQGHEMGRFLLGSTVVMLLPPAADGALRFNSAWVPTGNLRMGEAMANWS